MKGRLVRHISNAKPRGNKHIFYDLLHDCPIEDEDEERSECVIGFFQNLLAVAVGHEKLTACAVEKTEENIGDMTHEECREALRHLVGAAVDSR